MAEELYNVVFKGELVRGHELDEVKRNLSKLFKLDGPKLDALFSGKVITLKKNVNFENATKYRVAIKKAGARVDLQVIEEAKPATAHGKAVFGEARDQPSHSGKVDTSAEPAGASAEADDGPFQLAPLGALVLEKSERQEQAPVEIDVSSLSLKVGNGNLVDADEIEQPVPVDESSFELDLEQVSLAAVGDDLLRADEKENIIAAEVDTSELSLAEPGARLGTPKPQAPAPPDVSQLSLEQP